MLPPGLDCSASPTNQAEGTASRTAVALRLRRTARSLRNGPTGWICSASVQPFSAFATGEQAITWPPHVANKATGELSEVCDGTRSTGASRPNCRNFFSPRVPLCGSSITSGPAPPKLSDLSSRCGSGANFANLDNETHGCVCSGYSKLKRKYGLVVHHSKTIARHPHGS